MIRATHPPLARVAGSLVLSALVCSAFVSALEAAERIEIAWPTANRAYQDKRPLGEFIQPTESGEITSGLFGCVRTNGTQFHEGLDLKPEHRDRRGEATDDIFSVLPGVVRHINRVAGNSSYGRYIVLEHSEQAPAVYTLYAHLSQAAVELKVGDAVARGQRIATMGRSAGGYVIPKDRAHLHFEIGLRVSDEFQRWYDRKKFGSKNEHGNWNGMNLLGIDPLEFYSLFRDRRIDTFADYFRQLPEAVRVRVRSEQIPDFIRRYPSLRTQAAVETAAGWEISFSPFGIPFAWTPLSVADVSTLKAREVQIVRANEDVVRSARCKDLVKRVRGRWVPDRDLENTLQLIFGW